VEDIFQVVKGFLGNKKASNYKNLSPMMLTGFKTLDAT